MKNLKPSHLILIGSLIYLVISAASLLIYSAFFFPIPIGVILMAPLGSALVIFLLFYRLFQRFIQTRLQQIYKSIQINQDNSLVNESKINKLISRAEKDVEVWKENKNNEISKLKEQEQFRREFLGNLAHELKTPVFAVQGYILTLIEGGIDDSEVNLQFLNRAALATDRIVYILDDLDQITKLEVDTLKMNQRSFEINSLIREIVDSLEHSIQEKHITIEVNNENAQTHVFADKIKISQVLTNLIINAINYGNKNGKVVLSIDSIDELVSISVSDDGIGIDEANLPRIFERFYRVEKSRNRNEGGSGLGLAIVKHIIEAHQQMITVKSTVGVGSTFTFNLKKSPYNGPVSSRGIPL